MCGIVGFVDSLSLPFETILQNAARGTYSYGYVDLNDLHSIKTKLDKLSVQELEKELKSIYLADKPSLLHFRQPTSTGRDIWIPEENYPLWSKSYLLLGNGVINANYYSSIKDEDNNNDLYYILKGIEREGFDYLKKVEGCFAFAIVELNTKKVFLIRKDYPLYVTNLAFSSVKFPGSLLLDHGLLWEWGTTNKTDLHLSSVYA